MNSASLGDKALADSDFPGAIRYFTQALVELPRAAPYYIKRSTAYSRLKNADGGPNSNSALNDAEIALTLARERGKRELILTSQLRRGVALYQLGKYGDAAYLFGTIQDKIGADTEPGNRSEKVQDAMANGSSGSRASKAGFQHELPIWTLKVKSMLKKLPEGDERAGVSVAEYPTGVNVPGEGALKKQLAELNAGKVPGPPDSANNAKSKTSSIGQAANAEAGSVLSPSPVPTAPSVDKVRHEWYQSNDSVVVTLYIKGVPKDKMDAELKSDSVTLQFPLPSGADYDFTLDPLFAPIDTTSSKVSVMSTKIEIVLRKQTPGQKWSALEGSSSGVKLADRSMAAGHAPAPGAGPAYPSSSRTGAKDWDKVASTLTKKSDKSKKKSKSKDDKAANPEDPGENSDGAESVDSDYGGGDPVDGFFKKLYAGADPDTRRAMIKSYVESQGTSLSTNWNEVSQGKVEARPPSSD
ncbi:hypothetical protein FE257_012709 [Aspergillus nanangensis]|uniref:SGT1 and CS domain protein n=1 Tax=Aspergillus nanangensis TaxID=2582783 RepID=A0AAD4CGZ2_ASPNN|nr:hypothetical protein FE257_012709 [Aspergillus nanangensis]